MVILAVKEFTSAELKPFNMLGTFHLLSCQELTT